MPEQQCSEFPPLVPFGLSGAKTAHALADCTASAFPAPPKKHRLTALPPGMFLRSPRKCGRLPWEFASAILGRPKRLNNGNINMNTNTQNNIGRGVLIGLLICLVLFIAGLAAVGIFGSKDQFEHAKELLPLLVTLTTPLFTAAITFTYKGSPKRASLRLGSSRFFLCVNRSLFRFLSRDRHLANAARPLPGSAPVVLLSPAVQTALSVLPPAATALASPRPGAVGSPSPARFPQARSVSSWASSGAAGLPVSAPSQPQLESLQSPVFSGERISCELVPSARVSQNPPATLSPDSKPLSARRSSRQCGRRP